MPATDPPGLAEIEQWAAFLGIPLAETVRKVRDLLATDPAAVQAGGQTLETLASGLDTDVVASLRRAGEGVLAAGFGEQAANAFGTRHTEMVTEAGNAVTATGELATHLGAVARVFAETHQAVLSMTAATATALIMSRA